MQRRRRVVELICWYTRGCRRNGRVLATAVGLLAAAGFASPVLAEPPHELGPVDGTPATAQVAEASPRLAWLNAAEALSDSELREQRGIGNTSTQPSVTSGSGDLAVILWDDFKRPRDGGSSTGSQGHNRVKVTVTVTGQP